MLMGNERLIYIARNKFPGVPIHGKAGNINNVLKFHIFAKKARVPACVRMHVYMHMHPSSEVMRDNDIVIVYMHTRICMHTCSHAHTYRCRATTTSS